MPSFRSPSNLRSSIARVLPVLALGLPWATRGATPTPDDLALQRAWVGQLVSATSSRIPFSFLLDHQASADFLPKWRIDRTNRPLDSHRTEYTTVFTDPHHTLTVRWQIVVDTEFPAVEWTVHLANRGPQPTGIIEEVQALDTDFAASRGGSFTLHHAVGSPAEPRSFEPLVTAIGPGQETRVATTGGRPSNAAMPYWNLDTGGQGAVFAVGWPGQWAADFRHVDSGKLRIRAGQERTRFRLEAGEEVRGPLLALVFWTGDRQHGHNLWRSWLLARNLPRTRDGLPPTQLVACSSHQFNEMLEANEENQKLFIDRYLQERLPIRYWWMDAGWYVNSGSWVNTGTWQIDTKRFPRGLRAVTDHAHAKGVRSIVWFEPERVTPGTWLYDQHPDWLLSDSPDKPDPKKQRLLNLGHPEARRWLTDHIDGLIQEQGIDLYRQDFNVDPLNFWRANDAPDRQGITEIRYVSGYLAFWDELRRRHPDLIIDSCASGGRRNDLETVRRSVPLLRDDHLFEPIGQQAHTYGISFWLPYHGTGTLVGPSRIFPLPAGKVDVNMFRSHMAPSVNACWDVRRPDLDYDTLRRLTSQLLTVQPYFLGDYYPLTPYSRAKEAWIAWQFDRPDLGGGVVQAFRRDDAKDATLRCRLRGLSPQANYRVTDLDKTDRRVVSGRELQESGIEITLSDRPAAAVITYTKED
ncbi:MAG: alpha-galactosidase [Verrucomicrobiales bacterium]|nr:alpha-galactosidase [Verrucomicrobiales bacterium]